ncbi:MAG TPA: methyltransferase domain-containing protein [Vicinamibacterales bacterium]|nr:methyltransferase domain-containing protein [Vicinamibacterales bacterium]
MAHRWSPADYQQHAAFVPALGAPVLGWLAPQPGERILDLGCGDGALTQRLIEAGAVVVGVDASPEMVEAARARGIDARLADARTLAFDAEFDAVFSNAALHWIREADRVLAGVARALRPGGRFVAEFGGHTNVAAIDVAIRAVFARHGLAFVSPWYYPTPDEYRRTLEACGFTVREIRLFPRPTPLPTGMLGWLRAFGIARFDGVPAGLAAQIEAEIVDLLRPSLCDEQGQWTADYVRLQVAAVKPTEVQI